jgi:hypothetical protein
LLPALPVVYAGFAVALQAVRPTERRLAVAGLAICLIAANFINPIYPFPLENDLAFVDFVRLEQDATAAVRGGSVASVFPLTDALRNPDLGFVERAQRVTEITDFSPHEIARMKADPPEQLVVWNRDWDPLGLLAHPAVRDFVAKHYGYVPDMSADEIAVELSMRVVRRWKRHGFSMQLLSR